MAEIGSGRSSVPISMNSTLHNASVSVTRSFHQFQGAVTSLMVWCSTLHWLPSCILLTPAVLLVLTWTFSTTRSKSSGSEPSHKEGLGSVPLVPYRIPGVFHFIPFAWDPVNFIVNTTKKYGWVRPVVAKIGSDRLNFVVNPQLVAAVFKNSRFLSTRFVLERVERLLVCVPPDVMPFYLADDSGMAAEPRKGSKTPRGDRVLYEQAHTHHKWLASPHLDPLVQRFLGTLDINVEKLNIGQEWVECPDLFGFLQSILVRANIETMMGTKILELNPTLVEDFCMAKINVPEFLKGWPRWLVPKGFRARDRVVAALEKWQKYAYDAGDCKRTGDCDPDWDSVWGSKCEKVRHQFMSRMQPLTTHVRACEDWGFLIGLNYNTPQSVFWFFLEALRDPDLHSRLMTEVAASRRQDQSINIPTLMQQALLESAYAETLRLRVSIIMTRTVQYEDITIGGYSVPRGDVVLMPTDALHFNKDAWDQAGRPTETPLEQFDAERFLQSSETGGRVCSTDGLAGLWIPYGGGDRMCPGRHLVKAELLITFAYFMSKYEIEANEIDMCGVRGNEKYKSFGVLFPDRPLRFKIRRRFSVG